RRARRPSQPAADSDPETGSRGLNARWQSRCQLAACLVVSIGRWRRRKTRHGPDLGSRHNSVQEGLMQITGTVTLVTGANRGIGKAFADALLDRGTRRVYAAVRDVTTITDPRVVPIQLDVTDPDRVAAVVRELGDVQVVVNNAGVLHVGVPLSASLDAARVEL